MGTHRQTRPSMLPEKFTFVNGGVVRYTASMQTTKKTTNRAKTERFAAIKTFPNVFEFPDNLRGKWAKDYFKNTNPIVLELACGKGAYTLELARRFKDQNYIGVDLKGERIYIGAKQANEEHLLNVGFVRGFIEHLDIYFAPQEISEMWITFPDPFPRTKQAKHRLTSPNFLETYKKLLQPNGILHLKTDAEDLFTYSIETLRASGFEIIEVIDDIYSQSKINPLLTIQTDFEKKHLAAGRKIFYLQASLAAL